MIFAKMSFLERPSICPFEVFVIFKATSETKINKADVDVSLHRHLQWKKRKKKAGAQQQMTKIKVVSDRWGSGLRAPN